ncbi:acetyl-CoA carboxylase biotin carboxylase subunit [Microbacterium sp. VKM Ac-2870]|uniref:acetyl/propionyl/methylcrotonyl-CoA carboxylase subunit alpha n=1 Tax=Microbacterium sp. VKM Ac-2870 TaxID=2783825 RepID=UPI00188CBEEC|nr:acetyl-CoA carboxylase biotin carboxylase subunit [Microbacterium sp. VKM Ac-2870]MBF4562210.1 acetyl-CoA carboxylase biotin carboxylase subunit [Microbacterium sp. VKM Ac-2870]
MSTIEKVLIANRGEIAVRIIRTLRAVGIRSVAVYSDADADALHVQLADEAVRLGPASAAESYLSIERVLDAARQTGADAVHPGFGFLAENAAFARACAAAGVVFIGPSPEAIEIMGDKISAKQTVEARGVPTVPGIARPGLTDDELIAGAAEVGFPVLIKPSAGGGGKGMHVVTDAAELTAAVAAARREAAASFGDDTLFLERYVAAPRHIEVQVIADTHGTVVHLGERECSLQRRHQKVVEEAPSPLLDAETRARIGAAACETAQSVGYVGAGTVEFIVAGERPDEFFFMEMNTRLQVEHPVTEMVTGLDLVELQLRIAAGEPLPFTQEDVHLEGHAIEVRVYAEDPRAGFLPTGGRVDRVVHAHGDGVRVDTSLEDGLVVSTDYDPMLAKIIAWGPDRDEARRRLVRAIDDTAIFGLETNLPFLRLLLERPEVIAGDLDTGLIARVFDELPFVDASAKTFAEAALVRHEREAARDVAGGVSGPWTRGDGWRLGHAAPSVYNLVSGEASARVRVWSSPLRVAVDDGAPVPASVRLDAVGPGSASVVIDGRGRTFPVAVDPDGVWLHTDGGAVRVIERRIDDAADVEVDASPTVLSPLPGTVVLVAVADGDRVRVGDAVIAVEAMKMEHVLRAAVDGIVRLRVAVGDQVTRGGVVAAIEPAASDEE